MVILPCRPRDRICLFRQQQMSTHISHLDKCKLASHVRLAVYPHTEGDHHLLPTNQYRFYNTQSKCGFWLVAMCCLLLADTNCSAQHSFCKLNRSQLLIIHWKSCPVLYKCSLISTYCCCNKSQNFTTTSNQL